MHSKIWTVKAKKRILAVIALTLAFLALCGMTIPFAVYEARAVTLTTVVIDAGHGGADGGVTGRLSGVRESELNLTIAKIIGEYLESTGIKVVYTRKNARGLYSDVLTGSAKRDDMQKRARIINRAHPEAVVSIHMNYFNQYKRRGAQVFYNAENEKSVEFGKIMQEILNRDINEIYAERDCLALSAVKYILQCTDAPTIILECGFLSNAEDEMLLNDPEYRLKIGYVIFTGIIAYLSNGEA